MAAPQRGEVWLVDLGMAAKVRPAVVISVPAEDVDFRNESQIVDVSTGGAPEFQRGPIRVVPVGCRASTCGCPRAGRGAEHQSIAKQ
jgi:mRNA-degrading endonuclease toxin of MazEF toxin-antitoxin module